MAQEVENQQVPEEQPEDEYGTQDPIYDSFSEEELRSNPPRETEIDDTEGTVQVEGVTTDTEQSEVADDDPGTEEAADAGDDDGSEQDGGSEPEFDAALLQAAGLEESEARARFGSPEALENAVRLMDERLIRQWQAQNPPQDQQLNQQHQQQPNQMPTPGEEDDDGEEILELPEPSDGEEWGEDVVNLVQTIADHFNAKLAEQQRIIDQQRQFTEAYQREQSQKQVEQFVNEFDGFVDSLGENWKSVFGQGPGWQLDLKSPEVQARVHLANVSRQLEHGLRAQGLPPLSRHDLLSRALRVAFPQQTEQAVRREVRDQVAQRQRLQTRRPGNTAKKAASPEELAARNAEKWYADRGLGAQIGDEFEYDEI